MSQTYLTDFEQKTLEKCKYTNMEQAWVNFKTSRVAARKWLRDHNYEEHTDIPSRETSNRLLGMF